MCQYKKKEKKEIAEKILKEFDFQISVIVRTFIVTREFFLKI